MNLFKRIGAVSLVAASSLGAVIFLEIFPNPFFPKTEVREFHQSLTKEEKIPRPELPSTAEENYQVLMKEEKIPRPASRTPEEFHEYIMPAELKDNPQWHAFLEDWRHLSGLRSWTPEYSRAEETYRLKIRKFLLTDLDQPNILDVPIVALALQCAEIYIERYHTRFEDLDYQKSINDKRHIRHVQSHNDLPANVQDALRIFQSAEYVVNAQGVDAALKRLWEIQLEFAPNTLEIDPETLLRVMKLIHDVDKIEYIQSYKDSIADNIKLSMVTRILEEFPLDSEALKVLDLLKHKISKDYSDQDLKEFTTVFTFSSSRAEAMRLLNTE